MDRDLLLLRSKRGLLLDFFLVIFIFAFLGVVVYGFFNAQEDIHAAVISPVEVLEISDTAFFFELEEYDALLNSYCLHSSVEGMKEAYCQDFLSFEYREFLTSNSQPQEGKTLNAENLCEGVYEFMLVGQTLEVVRSGLQKELILTSSGTRDVIQYPVRFEYDLTKSYTFTSQNCNSVFS